MNEDDRKTPVDGRSELEEILDTVNELLAESRDIKIYSKRSCDSALAMAAQIPEINKRIDRIVLIQAWLPLAIVAAATTFEILWRAR